jgi:hypothetical protein
MFMIAARSLNLPFTAPVRRTTLLRRLLLVFPAAACFLGASLLAAELTLKSASKMVLEPSAASLAGGKAKLTTSALRRTSGEYTGHYQLKVFPYAFKNETGSLSIGVSDDAVRRLAAGVPVSFTGTVITDGTRRNRPASVLATPAGVGGRKGKMIITIATENGAIVFAPAYTLTGD